MPYPEFFDAVPPLRMRDALAQFLGALDDSVIEYTYLDAVKLAGHSCPTVASAYWMTHRALTALYGAEPASRGTIRIDFRDDRSAGVTGVIANVVSLLTGAAGDGGFKGIGGQFVRRDLLQFNADVPLTVRFTRCDDGSYADVAAHLDRVPADPAQSVLLQRWRAGEADAGDMRRFAALWQDRVRRILLEHAHDPAVFEVRLVKPDAVRFIAPGDEANVMLSSPPCYAHEFPGYFGETEPAPGTDKEES